MAPRARSFRKIFDGAIVERGKRRRLLSILNVSRSQRGPTEMIGTCGFLIRRSRRSCRKKIRAFLLVNTTKSKRSIFRMALSEARDNGTLQTSTWTLSVRAIDTCLMHRASKRLPKVRTIAPYCASVFSMYHAVISDCHCGEEAIPADACGECAGWSFAAAADDSRKRAFFMSGDCSISVVYRKKKRLQFRAARFYLNRKDTLSRSRCHFFGVKITINTLFENKSL